MKVLNNNVGERKFRPVSIRRPFTNFVFTTISFAMDHDLGKTICMNHQQVYQLRILKFSMQVHKRFFNNAFANIMQV
jgi:hypothetical protein